MDLLKSPHALLAGAALLALTAPASARFDYVATVHVVEGETAGTATGTVFHDLSRDGVRRDGEPGIAGVIVSNGRDVTTTGSDGRYELPVFDNMTVMVTKPSGYATPVDENGVPQFFHHHKPDGTPQKLRFGGLEPTGPLPAEINFPLVRRAESDEFRCIAMGDTQPYSNQEVGFVRDGVLDGIVDRNDLGDIPCMLLLGDVMGDDLGLLPRFMDMMSVVGVPQYYVHGNHDYDFDATSDEHSADSWRQLYGPNYYSFEIGNVFFVALDNVVYPCTEADRADDDRSRCGPTVEGEAVYNGRVPDQQMAWLEATLAEVPQDRLIVLMHHIPFVSFIDSQSGRHQTDNLADVHALVAGRPALSLSGHTHTFEYLAAGESFAGWAEKTGVSRVPFDHVVGGAPSGNWFQGDFGFDGTPLAFAREGTPPGYMIIEFDGSEFRITFHAANQPADRQMALGFNIPFFRTWFDQAMAFQRSVEGMGVDQVPPVTVNDLDDIKLFTPEELFDGVWLTANVWAGNRNTEVIARINDGPEMAMQRTQEGEGEGIREGAEFADLFAVQRQLTIGRYAWESQSGNPRTQGFEAFQGDRFGPVPPQGIRAGSVTDQSPHLWRLQMPQDLPEGAHIATVTATDQHGRTWMDRITFEVRGELAEAPVGRRDRLMGARQHESEPLGVVSIGLDAHGRALHCAGAASLGTALHCRHQLRQRQVALVGRAAEPLGRNPFDPLAPADIGTIAAPQIGAGVRNLNIGHRRSPATGRPRASLSTLDPSRQRTPSSSSKGVAGQQARRRGSARPTARRQGKPSPHGQARRLLDNPSRHGWRSFLVFIKPVKP